jgi:ATP-dependent helicase/nuclease subunit A
MTSRRPADHAEREKAIHERKRNVIVDAGAGTGKTTLLVSRLLHLIAPSDDSQAFSLERVAAITFTRKAAGELKLRLREKLLSEIGKAGLSATRQKRLASALEFLDNAMISTVHSFADRLLRLRPIDARLSPAYEIAEDSSVLIEEAYSKLLAAAARNGQSGCCQPREDPLWTAAVNTIRMLQAAGLLTRTVQTEWFDRLGLDAFVRDLIETRDRDVLIPELTSANLQAVRRHIDEFGRLMSELSVSTAGARRLRKLYDQAVRLAQATDETEALRRAVLWSRDLRKLNLRKGEHFPNDAQGWELCRWLLEGTRGSGKRKEERPGGPLGEAIVAPLFEHLANCLVQMRKLVLREYGDVKRSHGMVDQIDLLIQLRDLLRNDPAARSFYQQKFDHIMVDEFQDTDPLQAEIVMYLCEAGAKATPVQDVELKPGQLTIVGDPKQSIYRFRRADIAMYAMVCSKLRDGNACEASLRVNFRSASKILDWLNEGFDAVLGAEADGPLFDPEAGTVRNVRLVPAGKARPEAEVHVLPFGDEELKVEESRDLEGEALAHYLRFLVEDSEIQIEDPRTRELRRPRYGDIAIMMIATQTVHHLTSELDRIGVPHVVRGGTLFMQDALHQQFILGLRALSDPSDGVARAALKRPPFFAVSLEDLVRARVSETRGEPLETAELFITQLRRDRHQTTPGEFARHVVETTGFGRYVAASVNGAQRLARLYELCMALDDLSRTSNLDIDGVTTIARDWIDAPPRIEVPLPVDADAVQVITAHQAKGLEWPIVALWDGRAGWKTFLPQSAFTVDPLTGQWAIKLDGLEHDPSKRGLREREMELRAAERKRVAYVAATRARDVLIVPEAVEPSEKSIAGALLLSGKEIPHRRVVPYKRETKKGAWWKSQTAVSMRPLVPIRDDLQEAWNGAAKRAFAPYLRPAAVSVIAHTIRDDVRDADEQEVRPVFARVGRFGPVFGTSVHRALELLLKQRLSAEIATQRAVRENAVEALSATVLEDVTRTYAALQNAGLLEHTLQLEYPVAGSVEEDTLVSGFVDLLVAQPDGLSVIDFKTDAAPRGDVRDEYRAYVEQVRAYARVLEASGVPELRVARAGLLFTADGGLRWLG